MRHLVFQDKVFKILPLLTTVYVSKISVKGSAIELGTKMPRICLEFT